MRYSIVVTFFFFSLPVQGQMTWKDVLKRSESYYLSQSSGAVQINTTFKYLLKSDTTYKTRQFVYYRNLSLSKYFSLDDESCTFLKGNQIYGVNPSLQTYFFREHGKRDYPLKDIPFWDPSRFFKKFLNFGRWFPTKLTETQQNLIIKIDNKVDRVSTLYFDKTTFQLLKYVDIVTSKKYGSQYKEFEFTEPAFQLSQDSLNNEFQFILKNFKKQTEADIDDLFKASEQKKKKMINSKIDVSRLRNIITDSSDEKSGKKYLLLYFFAQGCLPCIKSIPELNFIHRYYDSVLVVGVDVPREDSGQTKNFISRFNVLYPIVDGDKADGIRKLLPGLRVLFPTMVLIKDDGTILNIFDGYSKEHYKLIKKNFDQQRM